MALLLSALIVATPGLTAVQAASVSCEASGYDVIITNDGTADVASGAVIAWMVPFARKTGTFETTRDLAPGERTVVSGAMGSDYLQAGTACTATIVSPA